MGEDAQGLTVEELRRGVQAVVVDTSATLFCVMTKFGDLEVIHQKNSHNNDLHCGYLRSRSLKEFP